MRNSNYFGHYPYFFIFNQFISILWLFFVVLLNLDFSSFRIWYSWFPRVLILNWWFGKINWLICKYTKYDISRHTAFYVTMATLRITLLMNKWTNIVMEDGWVHPLGKTLSSLANNLRWTIVMHDWKLDEWALDKWP